MKYVVISDTHGMTAAAASVIRNSGADAFIHLGDFARDAAGLERITGMKGIYVRGNCDSGSSAPDKLLLTAGGARILLVHGHNYAVDFSLLRLALAAEEEGAQTALFGHTHTPALEYENGVMLLNPGSLSRPRGCSPTYALLVAEGGRVTGKILKPTI